MLLLTLLYNTFDCKYNPGQPGLKIHLNHKCRVCYQIEIIADPKPYINFLYDCENRMSCFRVVMADFDALPANSAC